MFYISRVMRTIAVSTLVVACLSLLGAGVAGADAAPPSPRWVDLDGGQVGPYLWSVKTKGLDWAGAEQARGERPCVQAGATWKTGPFELRRTRFRDCASRPGRLAAVDSPLIATAAQPAGRGGSRSTVGIIAAPAVHSLRATLAGGVERTIPLRLLNRSRAQRASLGGRFRYAAFVLAGSWCADRLVTLNASGRVLWDSGVDGYSCSD
jgi:hypothetical protein